MVARTNQLNATGIRYSAAELSRRVTDSRNYAVYLAALRDRFGDYGQVGAALVHFGDLAAVQPAHPSASESDHNLVWTIELLLASCRVEGRSVPAALLITILAEARAAGVRQVHALYRRRAENRAALLL